MTLTPFLTLSDQLHVGYLIGMTEVQGILCKSGAVLTDQYIIQILNTTLSVTGATTLAQLETALEASLETDSLCLCRAPRLFAE